MPKAFNILALLLAVSSGLFAQDSTRKERHKFVLTSQFAGSTGLITNGLSLASPRSKLEAGALYGFLPERYGGKLHTITFKFTWNPLKVRLPLYCRWEPIQTGIFLTQHWGPGFHLTWENKYPHGYYWWPKGLRQHVFLSSQLSWVSRNRHLDRIAAYIEANTNDLYLYSYFPSRGSVKLYDILFLGLGLKVYLK